MKQQLEQVPREDNNYLSKTPEALVYCVSIFENLTATVQLGNQKNWIDIKNNACDCEEIDCEHIKAVYSFMEKIAEV